MKKLNALILVLSMILCLFTATLSALAAGTETTVEITFTGDESGVAGFMQSVISITPGDNAISEGYYLIYYTDGSKTLADYDELASVPVSDGKAVSVNISDGIMIPQSAKGIAVFESKARFLDNAPDIKTAVATAEIPESKRITLGTAEASFGAVSDVHMNYEQYDRGAYQKWANALDFYKEQGSGYIIVAGDMTGDRGETPDLEEQYEKYVEIINESDIEMSDIYECLGNHGNTEADRPLMNAYLQGSDEVHPYDDSPYYHILKEGDTRDNLFIFTCQEIEATGESSTRDNFSKAQMDWIEGLIKQYGKTETNIFLIIHSPFLSFGAGDRKGGGYTACITFKEEYTQTMRLKALLEEYKDIIVMSGHTHVSLYDNVNYSDEYNSFARTVHIGSTVQPCGYGGGSVYTRNTDGRYPVTTTYGSEGYTVDVYNDYIVFTGYNLSTGKKIPCACLIMPVHAFGGAGNPNLPKDPNEVFSGSGTKEDPYLISTPDDFMALTAGFNASSSTVESEMYGYGKYFLQTADIDMTNYYGYAGTEANGNAKAFFAGAYNGNGKTLTVNINGSNQRSVFPYVYGSVCNLHIKGSISSDASAQPIRTLYGSIVNCIFELELQAELANGIVYSNYSLIYNVYSFGTLAGSELNPVASNDSSKSCVNIYHYFESKGESVGDTVGVNSTSLAEIAEAFNNREGSQYKNAKKQIGNQALCDVEVRDGRLAFAQKTEEVETANSSAPEQESDAENTSEAEQVTASQGDRLDKWVIIVCVLLTAAAVAVIIVLKNKK